MSPDTAQKFMSKMSKINVSGYFWKLSSPNLNVRLELNPEQINILSSNCHSFVFTQFFPIPSVCPTRGPTP